MTPRLVLILGDQLSHQVSALREADRERDVVVMAEVMEESSHVPHHPKKLAFFLAAMRKFAAELQTAGWRVLYTRLDDPGTAGSITGEVLRRAGQVGATEAIATEPGEWRLISALEDCPLPVHQFPDDRFLCSHAEFDAWAEGRKTLRMEYFYREMRRRTGLLMEGTKPAGGKWNFDHDNRRPAPDGVRGADPPRFAPDASVRAVLDLVADRFAGNFGTLRPFRFATDRAQALAALDHFLAHGLPDFGDYQDAMLSDQPVLFHSMLSLYLNAGLLDPLEVCRAVEAEWRAGRVPLNAAEGFIRQIIGWREFMRGVYFREGPDYTARNALGHRRDLPALYWGAPTRMRCLSQAVGQTRDHAYAHHIQRLMVTGNFALLAGVDPAQVHDWYLAVYADAVEWVEAPNVIGMSQFADGGIVASKPYVSGGAYLNRMSDYCKECAYSPSVRTGQKACPFTLLFWAFIDRHEDRFRTNPRMAQMYGNWERMEKDRRAAILSDAAAFLDRLDAGDPV